MVIALTLPEPRHALSTSAAAPARMPLVHITLTARPPSPQLVGMRITWTATTTSTKTLVYRFSVGGAPTGPFTVLRDFSTHNTVVWAPLQEGTYYVQVSVKVEFGATAITSTVAPYLVLLRVWGTSAVVSRTANPLIALYSAPACSSGQSTVAFQATGSSTWTDTNTQQCQGRLSRNFLVAGLLPSTTYQMVHVVTNGTSVITSTPLFFTTGSLPRAELPHLRGAPAAGSSDRHLHGPALS